MAGCGRLQPFIALRAEGLVRVITGCSGHLWRQTSGHRWRRIVVGARAEVDVHVLPGRGGDILLDAEGAGSGVTDLQGEWWRRTVIMSGNPLLYRDPL